MIQGLESKPQFNGCYGSVVGNQGERILVALDNGEVHSESMVPFSMNLVNAMPLATSMHSCGILVDILIFSIFSPDHCCQGTQHSSAEVFIVAPFGIST
jgi:hypothetical protein